MTRRAYFLCSVRVIRRQSGASLNFRKLRQIYDFGYPKVPIGEDATVQFELDIFFKIQFMYSIPKNIGLAQFYTFMTPKSWDKDQQKCEKIRNVKIGTFRFRISLKSA